MSAELLDGDETLLAEANGLMVRLLPGQPWALLCNAPILSPWVALTEGEGEPVADGLPHDESTHGELQQAPAEHGVAQPTR